jgi:hypothetical protein
MVDSSASTYAYDNMLLSQLSVEFSNTARQLRDLWTELENTKATSLGDWTETSKAAYQQAENQLNALVQQIPVKQGVASSTIEEIRSILERANTQVAGYFQR